MGRREKQDESKIRDSRKPREKKTKGKRSSLSIAQRLGKKHGSKCYFQFVPSVFSETKQMVIYLVHLLRKVFVRFCIWG